MKLSNALLVLFGMAALSGHGQIYTYQLLPESTIAPMAGDVVTGPAQQLNGIFQLQVGTLDTTWSAQGFNYVNLSFASASYSFSLLTANQGNCSMVFGSDPCADFLPDVQVGGLSITSGTIHCYPNEGSYVGPYYEPTELNFPTLRLAPLHGGSWAAELSISAVLVPEPSPTVFILLALLVIFLLKRIEQSRQMHRTSR